MLTKEEITEILSKEEVIALKERLWVKEKSVKTLWVPFIEASLCERLLESREQVIDLEKLAEQGNNRFLRTSKLYTDIKEEYALQLQESTRVEENLQRVREIVSKLEEHIAELMRKEAIG